MTRSDDGLRRATARVIRVCGAAAVMAAWARAAPPPEGEAFFFTPPGFTQEGNHILNSGYRFPCVGASDYPMCRKLADCITYVETDELVQVTSTGRSLMPEGLEAAISTQEMADLIAFLQKVANHESDYNRDAGTDPGMERPR